jgi:hypothetical protein
VAQEAQLLADFKARSRRAGMLEVSQIKRAYEAAVGYPVPKSTVYRMLARQGWRKLAPCRRRPEVNRQRQRAFKKTPCVSP